MTDYRPGNNSQARGLAKALGFPYVEKHVVYSPLIRLPNFLKHNFPFGLDKEKSDPLDAPFPKVLISVGRRQAGIALNIKNKSPETFLAQIMWPGMPTKDFDLIITPEHDKKIGERVINSFGAMNWVTPELLEKHLVELKERPETQKTKIAFLIGGAGKGKHITNNQQLILKTLEKFKNKFDPYFMISTSRRTPPELIGEIKQKYGKDHWVYDWQETGENPYLTFLSLADYIIAPSDSVSMVSESCSTGKPVYIFETKDATSNKHRRFLDRLYAAGAAKKANGDIMKFTPDLVLAETARVAEKIKSFLKD